MEKIRMTKLKLAIGSDHGGFDLKEEIIVELKSWDYEVIDFGCFNKDSFDYPDSGHKVSRAVASGEVDRGILICTTGIGMSMVANRYSKVRAALCRSCDMTYLTRIHNNANMIVFGARYTTILDARAMLIVFLESQFSEVDRHIKRVEKIEKCLGPE